MGGRGQSLGRDWGSGDSSVNPNDIKDARDLVSQRNEGAGDRTKQVDDVLTVAKYMNDEYKEAGLIYQFQSAKMTKTAAGALAECDGNNIIINDSYMTKGMDKIYDSGGSFHPSRGKKSAVEAVAAHEFGHALTDKVAKKLGLKNMDVASNKIMREALKKSTTKNFAKNISGYATTNAAEAVAEAVCDVYCNGNKASSASKLVVETLNKYLKK